jgi:hypothetical protein
LLSTIAFKYLDTSKTAHKANSTANKRNIPHSRLLVTLHTSHTRLLVNSGKLVGE